METRSAMMVSTTISSTSVNPSLFFIGLPLPVRNPVHPDVGTSRVHVEHVLAFGRLLRRARIAAQAPLPAEGVLRHAAQEIEARLAFLVLAGGAPVDHALDQHGEARRIARLVGLALD